MRTRGTPNLGNLLMDTHLENMSLSNVAFCGKPIFLSMFFVDFVDLFGDATGFNIHLDLDTVF